MNRYQHLFSRLRDQKKAALIPFLMLGDPDPDTSFQHICAVLEAGADGLELGLPYSDPVADGPTIVQAANRALAAGVTTQNALTIIARVRTRFPDVPIGVLVYANLVYAQGVEAFFQMAKSVGVDSILVPDVPLREADVLVDAGKKHDIDTVFILPPNANESVARVVAQKSQGYVYLLSRAGVTGTETSAGMPLDHLLQLLRKHQSAPPILGFGISTPEQVKAAVADGAAGVIVGSALVNKTTQCNIEQLKAFIAELKAAT